MNCLTCLYYKPLKQGGLYACHYAILMNTLRKCKITECDKYVQKDALKTVTVLDLDAVLKRTNIIMKTGS